MFDHSELYGEPNSPIIVASFDEAFASGYEWMVEEFELAHKELKRAWERIYELESELAALRKWREEHEPQAEPKPAVDDEIITDAALEMENEDLKEQIRELNKEWADTSVRWADEIESRNQKIAKLKKQLASCKRCL